MLQMVDAVAREAMLFAACGLLIGGLDDLAIDLAFVVRSLIRRGRRRLTVAGLPAPGADAVMAVLVPAWDEAPVIGAMLAAAIRRYDHPAYRIYVGLYPNDPATIDAAAAVAERDPRIRLVIGRRAGPTTKADCLNTLWRALACDEDAGLRLRAVVLHDAEDVVHPAELRVFDALIADHDVVQIPVMPILKAQSRFVAAHYGDEFADAHVRQLVVRTAIGAGMPLAGTGCAIAPAMLRRLAAARGGDPFDADSLVEDYELGLGIARLGGRTRFARVDDGAGGVVAVRAFFPDTIDAAVRQKARWMAGIALAGWDRTGWSGPLALSDHWWRARDRRAPLAVLVLAAAYLALVAWAAASGARWLLERDDGALPTWAQPMLLVNAALLAWRLLVRAAATAHVYGAREALWSAPRLVVGNYIALLAVRRALWRYLMMLRGEPLLWDKTRHEFPEAGRLDDV